jgi:hypothetical protein
VLAYQSFDDELKVIPETNRAGLPILYSRLSMIEGDYTCKSKKNVEKNKHNFL